MKKEEFKYIISKQLNDSKSAICSLLHYTDSISRVNNSHYMHSTYFSSREHNLNIFLERISGNFEPLVMNVVFEDYEGSTRYLDIEDYAASSQFKNYRFMEDISLETNAIVFKVKVFKVHYNIDGYFVWDWQEDKDFVMRYDLFHGRFFNVREILHFRHMLESYRDNSDYYYLDLSLPNIRRQEIEQQISLCESSLETRLKLVKAFDLPQISNVTESVMWQVINQLLDAPLSSN